MSDTERVPVELARCPEHGLVAMETEENPHHSACITCEFGVAFRPFTTPEDDHLTDQDFRNRLEWETVTELVPLMRAYLEAEQDDPEIWVTHLPWEGALPAGYSEQERFVPVIGYAWGAMRKYIIRNSAASDTVEALRANGYGDTDE